MEPYIALLIDKPERPIHSEKAPVEFKNPRRELSMIVMTDEIIRGYRSFYLEDEIKKNPSIWQNACSMSIRNKLKATEIEDYISIRSNGTQIPCAASFMMPKREKIFNAIQPAGGTKVDITDYYIIFVTHDEILIADKSKKKPSDIKKDVIDIRNKASYMYKEASPFLCAEVFTYDREKQLYIET